MNTVIKEILMNQESRDVDNISSLVSSSLNAGDPWLDEV